MCTYTTQSSDIKMGDWDLSQNTRTVYLHKCTYIQQQHTLSLSLSLSLSHTHTHTHTQGCIRALKYSIHIAVYSFYSPVLSLLKSKQLTSWPSTASQFLLLLILFPLHVILLFVRVPSPFSCPSDTSSHLYIQSSSSPSFSFNFYSLLLFQYLPAPNVSWSCAYF